MTLTRLINLAETRLGFNPTAVIPGTTKQSEMLLLNYEVVAKAFLRGFPWPEATKRVRLDYSPGYPENLTMFEYQYDLPEDCLRPLDLNEDADEKYRVEGGLIYCNYEEPVLRYTSNIAFEYEGDGVTIDYLAELRYTDTTADALVWKLALTAVSNLAPKMAGLCAQNSQMAYYNAISASGGESREMYDPPELWTDA